MRKLTVIAVCLVLLLTACAPTTQGASIDVDGLNQQISVLTDENTQLKEKVSRLESDLSAEKNRTPAPTATPEATPVPDVETLKAEQKLTVEKTQIIVQDKQYKSLYPDLISAVVKNNTDETVRNFVVSFLAYDKNGYPVKIESQTSFTGGAYTMEATSEDANILPGDEYGSKSGWRLADPHDITYVLACVKEATFYNGETWVNDYEPIWLNEYAEKPLPEELKK